MTEKLYYYDSMLTEFTAVVQSCEETEKGWQTVLDRTAFYPEGGGQPADKGTLGGANVLDVREKNGEVIHLVDKPLTQGEAVTGQIDQAHRLDLMQQHTGEHIVSGIIHQLYGYDNVGFHIGSETVTIDLNGELTQENLLEVENRANEAVFQNLAVQVQYPDKEQLDALEYRSKKALTGQVRIVSVPGYDTCACCGTHFPMTGQVGLIKLVSAQKYKGGTRVTMLCGGRALKDYQQKNTSVLSISALTSAKSYEIIQAVERIQKEGEELRQKLADVRSQLFAGKVAELENAPFHCLFEQDLAPAEVRQLCLQLCSKGEVAAVFSGNDAQGYKYAVGSNVQDIRPLGKELNSGLNGRGGGSKELIQGSCTASREEIEAFWSKIPKQ